MYHLKQYESAFAHNPRRNLYIENLITGVNTFSRAKILYAKAKDLFAAASMSLREWASIAKKILWNYSCKKTRLPNEAWY